MGEKSKWFGKSSEEKPVEPEKVEQCYNCGHLVKTVCQNSRQVIKPNDSCSQWTE